MYKEPSWKDIFYAMLMYAHEKRYWIGMIALALVFIATSGCARPAGNYDWEALEGYREMRKREGTLYTTDVETRVLIHSKGLAAPDGTPFVR
ncbi:MAG: hypothetical protein CMJ75_18535 [Planctomycetaceae bacterium]|nr:hypothetical protein [Planctomycetaceae bacterium]